MAVGGGRVYWTNTLRHDRHDRARADQRRGVNQNFIPETGGASEWRSTPTRLLVELLPGSTIGRANLNGTNVNPSFITATGGSPLGLAVTATDIYWTSVSHTSETVTIFPRQPRRPEHPPSLVTGLPGALFGVAVGPSNLYWASFGSPDIESVGRANLDGTSPTTRASSAPPSPQAWLSTRARPTRAGSDATIIGTGRPDKLRGTKGDDVIAARAETTPWPGAAAMTSSAAVAATTGCAARAAATTLKGGGGKDELRGGGGSDRCRGGRGSDSKHHC